MKINGAGSIERRGKTWRIRFNLGVDPVTSKYRYSPWRTVHGTKADALAALAEYRQEIENGIKLDANKLTFAAYAETFIWQRRKKGSLAPSTIRDAEYQIKHLNHYIGEVFLREIDALTVDRLLAQFGADGHSPAAVKRVYATLRQILQEALLHDLITVNPCHKVKAPKKPKPPIVYLSSDELATFAVALDTIEDEARALADQHRATKPRKEHGYEKCEVRSAHRLAQAMAVRLGLATGARRGEILGLVWGYADLENQSLRIAQQMTKDGLRKPKTARGSRVVSLDTETTTRLANWKSYQKGYLEKLGIKQDKNTPIITNEIGGFCEPDGFSHWWRKFCKESGFEGLRFHDLRHTQATMLIAQGVDIKTVQNRLGHTLASTTLDLYAGVIPAKDREAADIVGGLLAGKRKSVRKPARDKNRQ